MSKMNIDLGDLDFNNIGNWKPIPKVISILFVSALIACLGYYLDSSKQIDTLDSLEKKENELKQLYELKQAKAANLDNYKVQLLDIQKTFGSLLNQLPSKTEVADLLSDITQTGLSNGLEFELFRPKEEKPQEFYAELPIELKVRGQYHEFGNFMSSVSALPRIVTIHDFTITVIKENKGKNKKHKQGELLLEAHANTYRYLDEKELAELSGKKK